MFNETVLSLGRFGRTRHCVYTSHSLATNKACFKTSLQNSWVSPEFLTLPWLSDVFFKYSEIFLSKGFTAYACVQKMFDFGILFWLLYFPSPLALNYFPLSTSWSVYIQCVYIHVVLFFIMHNEDKVLLLILPFYIFLLFLSWRCWCGRGRGR